MRIALCISLLFLGLVARGQNDMYFDKATEAYNAGMYQEAVENYLKILENGSHSATLYFNLGNSYYKLNQIAPSIYYYEKALLLDPGDPEITNNLSYARNMTLDAFEEMPESGFTKLYNQVTGLFTFDQWAYIAVAFMFLFVLSYVAFYYLRYASHKRFSFITSIAALLIAVISLAIGFLQYGDFKAEQPAIIFSEEVVVRSEPNARSQEAFVLHEGSRVNVVAELNDWNRIALSDGKTGWIPSDSMKLIKDF